MRNLAEPLQWLSKPSWFPPTYRPVAPIATLGRPEPAAFSTTSSHQARRKKGQGEKIDTRVRESKIDGNIKSPETLTVLLSGDIRYHLSHPLTPRPLRLSRMRSLRHWTINRAWQLFKAKQRQDQELTLERQYNSMRDACEALRLTGEDGLSVPGDTGSARTVRPPGARDPQTVSVLVGANGARLGKVVGPRWAIQGKKAVPEAVAGEQPIELDLASAAATQRDVGRLYRIAMEKKGVFAGVPIEYSRLQTDTPSKAGWDHEWRRASLAGIKAK